MPVDYCSNSDILDAFERALKKLIVDRRHPEALVVAQHLISIAKAGVCEAPRLCDLTVQAVWVEWHGRGHQKARALGQC
jgi:hypothetical protein